VREQTWQAPRYKTTNKPDTLMNRTLKYKAAVIVGVSAGIGVGAANRSVALGAWILGYPHGLSRAPALSQCLTKSIV
jgi:hypothetical protein